MATGIWKGKISDQDVASSRNELITIRTSTTPVLNPELLLLVLLEIGRGVKVDHATRRPGGRNSDHDPLHA
jgi:hypothetical protein